MVALYLKAGGKLIDKGEPKTGIAEEGQLDQNAADQRSSFPQTVFNVTKDTATSFLNDDCMVLAGAVAYSALQSIIPLVLGFISVGSLFLKNPENRQHFIAVLVAAVPPELSSLVKFDDLIENFIDGAGFAGIISVLILLWTGSGVFGQLKYAVNKAFRVQKDLRNPVVQTAIQLLMLLILGGLMIAAIGVNIVFGLFFHIKLGIFGISPYSFSFILPFLSYAIPFGLEAAVFTFLYKFSPARKGVRWKPVILAGLITGGLFELLKVLFGVYLDVFDAAGSAAKTYGAIGGIFVFLFFLYLTAIVILIGAELAARLHNFPAGLATAKTREALVQSPAEDIQGLMVPKKFARIVKKAEKTRQLANATAYNKAFSASVLASPESAPFENADLVPLSPYSQEPKLSGRESELGAKPLEERMAILTGTLVLVMAAFVALVLRRKPPVN